MTDQNKDHDHQWKHTSEEWGEATYTSDWPRCRKCGMSLRDFIDGIDIPSSAMRRSVLPERHRKIISQINSLPPSAGWSEYFPVELDPTAPLKKWGGRSGQDERPMLAVGGLRQISWAFIRMAGWHLYFEGGVERMRETFSMVVKQAHYQDTQVSARIESLWHEIGGLGMWLGENDRWII